MPSFYELTEDEVKILLEAMELLMGYYPPPPLNKLQEYLDLIHYLGTRERR